jgi:hypothetical protein
MGHYANACLDKESKEKIESNAMMAVFVGVVSKAQEVQGLKVHQELDDFFDYFSFKHDWQ